MSPTCTSYREWVRQIKSNSMLEKQTNAHLGQMFTSFCLQNRFKANMQIQKEQNTVQTTESLRATFFLCSHCSHTSLGGGQLTLKLGLQIDCKLWFSFCGMHDDGISQILFCLGIDKILRCLGIGKILRCLGIDIILSINLVDYALLHGCTESNSWQSIFLPFSSNIKETT